MQGPEKSEGEQEASFLNVTVSFGDVGFIPQSISLPSMGNELHVFITQVPPLEQIYPSAQPQSAVQATPSPGKVAGQDPTGAVHDALLPPFIAEHDHCHVDPD